MDSDKNGGPVYLRAWREYRELTQEQLAEKVGTNANMIQYLETGERGLSTKWARRLAPALDTTPGMLLEHDPFNLDSDMIDIWIHGDIRQRRQIAEIAKALVKSGPIGPFRLGGWTRWLPNLPSCLTVGTPARASPTRAAHRLGGLRGQRNQHRLHVRAGAGASSARRLVADEAARHGAGKGGSRNRQAAQHLHSTFDPSAQHKR
jgi:transcriptional regulator with XRE-family HTH domain